MGTVRELFRAGADAGLRRRGPERVALRRAARNGRDMVLLWHRVGPRGPAAHEVVRTVALSSFASQLDLLTRLGEIVALGELARPGAGDRPRFALTFDDDDPGHTRWALPALAERGLPATFFLSGRWQTPLGPYWWEVLERRVQDRGAPAVAVDLGLPPDTTPPRIAAAIAGTALAGSLHDEDPTTTVVTMRGSEALELVAAGMTIGFHTRRHDVLPTLDDRTLDSAVTDGRSELEHELQTPLDQFAYPHGRADQRVVEAVAAAGYATAWTTTKRLARPSDPPLTRGRWDLGHLGPEGFRARIVRALARSRS